MRAQRSGPAVAVSVGLLAIIAVPAALQTGVELWRGERPLTFEAGAIGAGVRPWMQYAQFVLLADAGEKAIIGRDGWLFYRPGVEYLTGREARGAPPPTAARGGASDVGALQAIVSFRDQLAARGIELLVIPAPNKESIYPEKLTRRAEGIEVVVCRPTRELARRLEAAGVAVVDLFEEYRQAKEKVEMGRDSDPLYLVQDSHWSPAGIEVAARAVARAAIERGWAARGSTAYERIPRPLSRMGDLIRMLQAPPIERSLSPEKIACEQIVDAASGAPYRDAAEAPILVLGDSFLRIFERDEPGAAGFIAHLAFELRQPLASIVNDGGASTLVRQELHRRPELLVGKKLVIWEFVERDIKLGTEGWQLVPLPELAGGQRR